MNTKKYFITLFSFIIFSIYFTLSGVFVPFIASIPQSNGGFKTLSSQNDFYKMVDNFYDPDEFYNFRTDNQNINILANFYNTLNASSNFDVLTSFNQAILLNILCLYLFNHILKSICNQSTLRKKHNKIFMLNIVIPYGSAFLLGTSLATLFIKKILPISIIIGIITLVLIYLINYLFLSKFLHVSSNLQQ